MQYKQQNTGLSCAGTERIKLRLSCAERERPTLHIPTRVRMCAQMYAGDISSSRHTHTPLHACVHMTLATRQRSFTTPTHKHTMGEESAHLHRSCTCAQERYHPYRQIHCTLPLCPVTSAAGQQLQPLPLLLLPHRQIQTDTAATSSYLCRTMPIPTEATTAAAPAQADSQKPQAAVLPPCENPLQQLLLL
jgi:hypothetical protein